MTLYQMGSWLKPVLIATLGLFSLEALADIELGAPPRAPKDVSGFPRQPDSLVSGGFSVNTTNREDVRSFFNAIYPASDNVPMNSTANTAGCIPGTNSPDFNDA